MSTVERERKEDDPDEVERQQREAQKPLLSQCYNLHDFEAVARRVMKKTAWGYYSSAADDEIVSLPTPLQLLERSYTFLPGAEENKEEED